MLHLFTRGQKTKKLGTLHLLCSCFQHTLSLIQCMFQELVLYFHCTVLVINPSSYQDIILGVFFVIWLKGASLNYCYHDCLTNLGFWINIFTKLYVYPYYAYHIHNVANTVTLSNSFIIGKIVGLFSIMNVLGDRYSILHMKYFNEIKMYSHM